MKEHPQIDGVRSWLIACDESGVHGSPHYGFGSLWLRWQRRGNFYADYYNLASKHGFVDECKWSSANRKHLLPFYQDLISYFFQKRWMVFHCLVCRKETIQKQVYHNNDWDLARRKHYTMLLTRKIRQAVQRFPQRKHEFRVYVDPIASRYNKADEAMEVISNNVLNQRFRHINPVVSVVTRDSKETPAIQVCDLLLGAVMESWQQRATNLTKRAIRRTIAWHLGWNDLDSDTMPTERKFNIWYFLDPSRESRRVETKKVRLHFPYP
ncbi:MAG TPA: DUF3800 domain-containing protein [Pyrinomonadaceae bacterium]|nr:DUF3800 domain-containing protein [Pyrinomonadaceae bacterium]